MRKKLGKPIRESPFRKCLSGFVCFRKKYIQEVSIRGHTLKVGFVENSLNAYHWFVGNTVDNLRQQWRRLTGSLVDDFSSILLETCGQFCQLLLFGTLLTTLKISKELYVDLFSTLLIISWQFDWWLTGSFVDDLPVALLTTRWQLSWRLVGKFVEDYEDFLVTLLKICYKF